MTLALNVSWNELKAIKSDLASKFYYATSANSTIAVFVACPVFYATTVLKVQSDIDDFTANYQSDSIVSDTSTGALARALSKKVSGDATPVSIKSRNETNFLQWTIVSHDYTDKTTWYQKSVQISNEILTGTSSNTVFPSANGNWINPDHPKLYNQSYNTGVSPYGQTSLWMPDGSRLAKSFFRPIITINDIPQTSGFSIDYATGIITFSSSVVGTVKATYFYATTSEFILFPRTSGVIWQVPRVEVNTTSSLIFDATTYFQYWRDPTFSFSTGAFMVAEMPYQSFMQLQSSATTGADIYPPMGGTGLMSPSAENGWGIGYKRGTDQSSVIIPWTYRKPFVMTASSFDTIRLFTGGDNVHRGADYLNATFYVEETPE